jgi:hypothetical protein
MANSTVANPWILDTAGVITTSNIWMEKMVYVPNAADNDLIVKDNGGNIVWSIRAIASAANNESTGMEHFDGPLLLNGFNLDTIDGGTLRVYMR